jgi:hypothetical protein
MVILPLCGMQPLSHKGKRGIGLNNAHEQEALIMSPDNRKSPKKPAKRAEVKPARHATKSTKGATRGRLTKVSELDFNRARAWWMGLQVPGDQIDTTHYAVAFAACLSLAGALDDDRETEIRINRALANGLKSTETVQAMQEALAVYFKANALHRALENELSDGSNPIMPIGIWAYLQREYVANGKLTAKEAKVLEGTLMQACLPVDGDASRVSSAVKLLTTGNLEDAARRSSGSGGGCALPAATMMLVLLGLVAI